jgi:hypothetical protein
MGFNTEFAENTEKRSGKQRIRKKNKREKQKES